MKPAQELQWFANGLLAFWQAYDPSVKVDLSCSAIVTDGKMLFIDPIPLAEAALAELTAEAIPAGIVLTSANHERAGVDFARRFQIPLYAHSDAIVGLSLTVDGVLNDGDTVSDILTVVALPGAAPGEIALYWPANRGVLFFGDALINLESTGLCFLPDKYCTDSKRLKRSAQRLAQFPAEIMVFAHGLPIVAQAQERLSAQLID